MLKVIVKILTNKITLIVVLVYIFSGFIFPDLNLFGKRTTKMTGSVLLESIEPISELFSMKYYTEVYEKEVRKHFLSSKEVLSASFRATCIAGIDLKDMEVKYSKNDSCHLLIPEAKILHYTRNPKDRDIFLNEGEWTHEDLVRLGKAAESRIRQEAIKDGLIDKSNKRNIVLLTNWIKLLGFQKVYVQVMPRLDVDKIDS